MNTWPCFECGADAHQQHHVVPRSLGGTRTVPLCDGCHAKAHSLRSTSRALTKAALDAKRAKGECVGTAPYGMKLASDGVRLIPHAGEQLVIQRVRQLKAAGRPRRGIVRELATAGFVNRRGFPFSLTSVCRMLKTA